MRAMADRGDIVESSSRNAAGAQALTDLSVGTLRRNWREGVRQEDGVRFVYTRPSPGHYPFQWYWDSCFAAIVWRRFDPTRSRAELESLLAAERHDVCCEVMTNVICRLSLLALGRPSLTPVIVERMYDEQAGLFRPIARPHPAREPTVTWAALSPLVLPDLPDAIGRRLVEDHPLDPERFWLPLPPPSVPANEPSFSRRESTLGIKRYWRGPTWINASWLVWLGLIRLGYREQANVLRDGLSGAIAAEGLREFYDPYTGQGMGATDFAWSALIVEMLDPDARAAASFLD
jgi:hypothetical protein